MSDHAAARALLQRVLRRIEAQQPPRQSQGRGIEVWRLRETATGCVQSCELRNDSTGAAWEVWVLENGEPLYGAWCGNERVGRRAAHTIKQDIMRGDDWVEDERTAIEKGGA